MNSNYVTGKNWDYSRIRRFVHIIGVYELDILDVYNPLEEKSFNFFPGATIEQLVSKVVSGSYTKNMWIEGSQS